MGEDTGEGVGEGVVGRKRVGGAGELLRDSQGNGDEERGASGVVGEGDLSVTCWLLKRSRGSGEADTTGSPCDELGE